MDPAPKGLFVSQNINTTLPVARYLARSHWGTYIMPLDQKIYQKCKLALLVSVRVACALVTKFLPCALIRAPLYWRHSGRAGVSNHQHHDCLLNGLFRRRSKKTSKLRVTGFVRRIPVNSPPKWPVTRKMFPFDDAIMRYSKVKLWGHTCWIMITFKPLIQAAPF